MIQLTIFDIKKTKTSEDEINSWKWKMLLKINEAYEKNKISENEYFTLKERVDIYLDYTNEWNLESDDNE